MIFQILCIMELVVIIFCIIIYINFREHLVRKYLEKRSEQIDLNLKGKAEARIQAMYERCDKEFEQYSQDICAEKARISKDFEIFKSSINAQRLDAQADFATEKNKMLEDAMTLEKRYATQKQQLTREANALELQVEKSKSALLAINENISTQQAATAKLLEEQKQILDENFQSNYDQMSLNYSRDLKIQLEQLKEDAANELAEYLCSGQKELSELQKAIEEYRTKRNIINEEILRQRAISEQQDFYRVMLTPDQKADIELLESVRTKLHAHESLDKLIYDIYVSKAVNEMIKRVLKGESPSGIYKITRLKTNEVYIGKSSDVKSRWQQHCKTAFGVGTIAHSILHTTMSKDGIDEFTFELLEEVPKDKLTEREKYYIEFYDSSKYGMNERIG